MDDVHSTPLAMQDSEGSEAPRSPSPQDEGVLGVTEHDSGNDDNLHEAATNEDAFQGLTEPPSYLTSSDIISDPESAELYDIQRPENDIAQQGGPSKKALAVNTNIRGPQVPSLELTPHEPSSREGPPDAFQGEYHSLLSPTYSSPRHGRSPSRIRVELAARPESRPGSAFAPHDPHVEFPFANARSPMSPWRRAGHARSRSDNYLGRPPVRHTTLVPERSGDELMDDNNPLVRDQNVRVRNDVSQLQVIEQERSARLVKEQRISEEQELVDAELGKKGFLYPNSADAKIMQLLVESYLLSAEIARVLEHPIKMQGHSMTAHKIARGLKYPPLEAMCQYWIGLALYSQEAWIPATDAFRMSKGAEGRYIRLGEVEKAVKAAEAANENEDTECAAVPFHDLTLCLREDMEDILQEQKHHHADVAEGFEVIPMDVIAQESARPDNESSGHGGLVSTNMSDKAEKTEQQEGKDRVENAACDDEPSPWHFDLRKPQISEHLSEELLRSCTPRSLQEELSDIMSGSERTDSDNGDQEIALFRGGNAGHNVQADEGPVIQHPQPHRPIATAHIEAASRRQSPPNEGLDSRMRDFFNSQGYEIHVQDEGQIDEGSERSESSNRGPLDESQSPPSPLSPSSPRG